MNVPRTFGYWVDSRKCNPIILHFVRTEANPTNKKAAMPILALGGEKSFGPTMAVAMRAAATNVTEAVVPHSGHWVMEENPAATIKLVVDFLTR